MPSNDYRQSWAHIKELAVAVAIDIAWDQWVSLGSLAGPVRRLDPTWMVDPEVLVLMSELRVGDEPRLGDQLDWWAAVGTPQTSIQRMRTFVGQAPEIWSPALERFATRASVAGHRSWSRLARPNESPDTRPTRLKGPASLVLRGPSTFLVRLRAAYGVATKTDCMSYLVGLRGGLATVSDIARALGYTETAVRDAVGDMLIAGVVQDTGERPARFMVPNPTRSPIPAEAIPMSKPTEGFTGLYRVAEPVVSYSADSDPHTPRWIHWPALFRFLAGAHASAVRAMGDPGSEFSQASRARDLVESHRWVLAVHGIPLPDLASYPGPRFVDALLTILDSIERWAWGPAK